MLTTLLNLAGAIASAITAVADWLSRRRLIQAGEDRAKAKMSEEQLEKINRANRARIAARDDDSLRAKWSRD